MDTCCRICRRKELKDFFPLNYRNEFYSETVLSMMQSVTGLEGALGDQFPQQICRICMGSLVTAFELRQLCLESYAYFQKAIQSDSQTLEKEESEETPPCDEIDGNDLESCLTLEQIKLEPFVNDDEAVTDIPETDQGHGAEDRFYCCFANCRVNYQFKELLIEHAAADHRSQKVKNEAKRNESEFHCIVCARTFKDEIKLLEHRNRNKTATFRCSYCGYQTEYKALYVEHTRAHNKKVKICGCGFRTTTTFTFNRHQTKCVPSKRKIPFRRGRNKWNALHEHIADDKTNDEIVAMGFTLNRHSSMFYCCISHCTTVCVTQQELSDHFQAAHPEVREENMKHDSADGSNVLRCPICFHASATKKALQIHLEDAYVPTFRCNICRYGCTSRKSAILHASMSCERKIHRCSCGFETPYGYNIKRHIKDCPGFRQGGSTLKYTKTRRNKLTRQLQKCKYCGKSFATLENLRRHMDSELALVLAKQEEHDAGKKIEGSEQKQYTCRWCNAIVVNDVNHLVQCMINSERAADGQNQEYKCLNCNESFKLYSLYTVHTSQVCSVEIPNSWLSCKHCALKFSTQNALRKHVAEGHLPSDRFAKAKRYECEDCLQRFVTMFTLKRHRKNLHKEVEDYEKKSDN